tara:strand:- start:19 stop:246 length:228 start_codon:yes stop_codon:yes gene_type:complete
MKNENHPLVDTILQLGEMPPITSNEMVRSLEIMLDSYIKTVATQPENENYRAFSKAGLDGIETFLEVLVKIKEVA